LLKHCCKYVDRALLLENVTHPHAPIACLFAIRCRRGCAPNKTALLQLAYAVDKRGRNWRPRPDGKGVVVLLLHIFYSGITPKLQVRRSAFVG
jgi:hypothetical protein